MSEERSQPFDLSSLVVGLHRDGRARLIEEGPGPPTRIDGFTVGALWHRVLVDEPSQLVHITPGPGGEHRPLERR